MGKLVSTLGALTLAAALAACDSDAATPQTPPPAAGKTTQPPAPTASARPTPPLLPQAATTHTKAGAEAFARFYVEVVNYGEQTLDTGPIAAISAPTCDACRAGIQALQEIAKQDGHIVGGMNEIRAVHAAPFSAGHSELVVLTLDVAPEQVIISGKKTQHRPGGASKLAVGLLPTETGWNVGDFRTAK